MKGSSIGSVFSQQLGKLLPDQVGNLMILVYDWRLSHSHSTTGFALKSPFFESEQTWKTMGIQEWHFRGFLETVLNHLPATVGAARSCTIQRSSDFKMSLVL